MKTLRKSICALSAALAVSSLLSLASFAAGPGSDGGGASICLDERGKEEKNCDQLLDTYLKNNQLRFDRLGAYKKIVQPKLKQLAKVLPDFAAELQEAVVEKSWYISGLKQKIPHLGEDGNGTNLPVAQRAVQYQNEKEVWINKAWFDSRPTDEQADLIFHELLMHIRLKSLNGKQALNSGKSYMPGYQDELSYRHLFSGSPSIDAIRKIVALIGQDELPSTTLLQKRLAEYSFGAYQTGMQKQQFKKETLVILKKLQKSCHASDDGVSEVTPRLLAMGTVLRDVLINKGAAINMDPQVRELSVQEKMAISLAWVNFYRTLSHGDEYGVVYRSESDGRGKYAPDLVLLTDSKTGKPYIARDTLTAQKAMGLEFISSDATIPSPDRTCRYVEKVLKREKNISAEGSPQEDYSNSAPAY